VTFDTWIARLRARGFVLCPASSAVPVEVRGVTPRGVGVHFRCRGVRVRLRVYRPGRAAWQIPLRDDGWCPEESLELWVHRPVVGAGVPERGRLVFPDEAPPDDELVLDGSREWGWRSHEAGLLRAAEAAPLFDLMLAGAGLTDTGLDDAGPDDAGPAWTAGSRSVLAAAGGDGRRTRDANPDVARAVVEAASEAVDLARIAHLVGAGTAMGPTVRTRHETTPNTPYVLPTARRPDSDQTADQIR